ncbi:MAG: hypothetical protein LBP79_04010 [Clostridiales bacterium]|jgi:hypothetical protein|nr:hypothetical protein [Clostridiales bacterium]
MANKKIPQKETAFIPGLLEGDRNMLYETPKKSSVPVPKAQAHKDVIPKKVAHKNTVPQKAPPIALPPVDPAKVYAPTYATFTGPQTAPHKNSLPPVAPHRNILPKRAPHKNTLPQPAPYEDFIPEIAPQKEYDATRLTFGGPEAAPFRNYAPNESYYTGPQASPYTNRLPDVAPHKDTKPVRQPHKDVKPKRAPHKSVTPPQEPDKINIFSSYNLNFDPGEAVMPPDPFAGHKRMKKLKKKDR